MATPEILLTEDQRLEFTQIPQNISEYEIVKYYTFRPMILALLTNIEEIITVLASLFN